MLELTSLCCCVVCRHLSHVGWNAETGFDVSYCMFHFFFCETCAKICVVYLCKLKCTVLVISAVYWWEAAFPENQALKGTYRFED